jgi:hypothetical protein
VEGWTGKRCDEDEDECSEEPPVCQEFADCINTPGSFNCNCSDGYELDEENEECILIVEEEARMCPAWLPDSWPDAVWWGFGANQHLLCWIWWLLILLLLCCCLCCLAARRRRKPKEVEEEPGAQRRLSKSDLTDDLDRIDLEKHASVEVELEPPPEPKEEPPLPQATALSGEHIIAEANLSLESDEDEDEGEDHSNALHQTPSELPLSPPPEPPTAPVAPVAVAAKRKKALEFGKGAVPKKEKKKTEVILLNPAEQEKRDIEWMKLEKVKLRKVETNAHKKKAAEDEGPAFVALSKRQLSESQSSNAPQAATSPLSKPHFLSRKPSSSSRQDSVRIFTSTKNLDVSPSPSGPSSPAGGVDLRSDSFRTTPSPSTPSQGFSSRAMAPAADVEIESDSDGPPPELNEDGPSMELE